MAKEIKGADLSLNDIMELVSIIESYFRKDYIDKINHLDVEDVKLENMVGTLNVLMDKEEILMLAECVDKILLRRMDMLNGVEKFAKDFSSTEGDEEIFKP